MHPNQKTSANTATRTVNRGYGATGITVTLSITHMQHISMILVEMEKLREDHKTGHMDTCHADFTIAQAQNIFKFMAREDFPLPTDPDLWKINDDEPEARTMKPM